MQAAQAGVQDPEELLQIKLQGNVNKFVNRAQLRFGEIKAVYIEEADAATTGEGVKAAYTKAENAARALLTEIENTMQEEVLSVAPAFDLSEANEKINTMLQEAQIEVLIVDAQKNSQLSVRDFKTGFLG